jgi:hypothetical protein
MAAPFVLNFDGSLHKLCNELQITSSAVKQNSLRMAGGKICRLIESCSVSWVTILHVSFQVKRSKFYCANTVRLLPTGGVGGCAEKMSKENTLHSSVICIDLGNNRRLTTVELFLGIGNIGLLILPMYVNCTQSDEH